MAHNLSFNKATGQYSYFGTEAAWHKLGQIVQGARNWQEAMTLAGLNWEVTKEKLLSPYTQAPLDSAFGIFRVDNKELLGVVGDKYTPIQNKYAFDFVDAILEADNGAHYESAGALGSGEKIWTLAKINGETDITETGDLHKYYLLFCTSHDGSLAATCKLTTVRVVCNNTLTRALNLNGEFTRIKHTESAQRKLDEAKQLVTMANLGIKDIENKLRELSKRIVSKESFTNVMKKLFGDWEAKKDKDQSTARIENKIKEVANLYASNDKNQFPEIKGTAYNLLNSITEWTDHQAGIRRTEGKTGLTDGQIRAENSLFGTGAQFKEKALEIIIQTTANDKRKAETMYFDAPQATPPAPKNGEIDSILSMVQL